MGTILDDLTACTNAIRDSAYQGFNWFVMLMWFWLCVLISSFTLFNMLLALLVEVVTATKEGGKIKQDTQELDETMVRFFREMDQDGNGTITRDEFLSVRDHPVIWETLEKLEI